MNSPRHVLVLCWCGALVPQVWGQLLDDDLLGDELLGPAREALRAVEEREKAEAARKKEEADRAAERAAKAQSAAISTEALRQVAHPRLLVTPERLATIRKEIKVPGSHFQQAHALMVRHCAADPAVVWKGHKYTASYAIREAAFLSLVAEHPAEKRRYAEMAARYMPSVDRVRWYEFKSASLGHAMATMGVALAYDWAYPEWTEEERRKAENLLNYFRGHWTVYHRVSEKPENVTGYNFYGVLFGSQILMHLAMGLEKTDPRLALCSEILAHYLADVGRELGGHNEAYGYTEYPMSFALPAAFALAQHGDTRPLEAAKSHAFWDLGLFVQTYQTDFARKVLNYMGGQPADHQSGGGNQGFASLVLGLCPPERLPHYLWHYDRHEGRLAKADPDKRYDTYRGNGFSSLLFYPPDVVARDPTGTLPKMAVDSSGYFFFRNRWQDENDILVGLTNPTRRSGGHFSPAYLNFSVSAYDSVFVSSHLGQGANRFTTVLVDGKSCPATGTNGGFVAGRTLAAETRPSGGYVIADAGDVYAPLGVTGAVKEKYGMIR